MIFRIKIFCILALVFATVSAVAQPRGGMNGTPPPPPGGKFEKPTHKSVSDDKKPIIDTTIVEDNFVMPKDAPYFDSSDNRIYHLRRVNIHGAKHINHDVIRSSSGLVPGDSIFLSGSFIQNAMMRLWSQRYFEDIQIGATIEGDSVDLEVVLRERPRVMNWAITGVPKGKAKEIIDETLKLKRGHELSDHIVDRNIKLLKEHFGEKGFLDCDIKVNIEPDSVIKQAVNVTFDVKKNKRIRIGDITFEGNDNFDNKRLARTFKKTHKVSAYFWQKTKFNEKEYEEDKELMLDFYNSKGYRNANILSDSIYRFTTKKGKERIGINIKLAEGNKYFIRNVNWVGNAKYDTETLQRILSVNKGDVYDKKSIHKRLGIGKEMNPDEMSVSTLYQNDGYLMSQVEPDEIIIGKDSLDLEIKIFEGKQFTINNVGITGNNRVNDEVIRRELYTRPGELYNRALIMQTMRTLAENMAWLLKCIEAGRKAGIPEPKEEIKVRTNFIR